uniref:Tripartite motif containing 39 n=1 Tax=Terrapene triunguis TaxID=2587831 RepID=A0A674IDK2_9SAUR
RDSWVDCNSATCPVCLEYFTEPVTLECGHNFCRACISQCWEGSDTATSCPQCRETVQQRNLRPNRQLANVVEIAKRLSLQAAKGAGGDGVCGEHQETLKLFCEEDQTPICVICRESRAHRAHTVAPIQEAAQEYKVLNCCPTETKRQKIVSEFQQLRQFLEEQERLLLAQLEKLDEAIVKIQNENVTKLSEEISHLSETVVTSLLNSGAQDRGSSLGSRTVPARTGLLGSVRNDTAHPILVLSEDWKSVRWGDTRQRLQDNPERFDSDPCVLGCEGFTSGRHCWEVEVGDGRFWAVGVARESVRRKGEMNCSPKGGIWAVRRWWGQFRALTSPVTPLPLSWAPSRIRVCLDCDRGQVTFIDAGDEAPIFTFPPASFNTERIRLCLCDPGDCFGSQPLHCQSIESIH